MPENTGYVGRRGWTVRVPVWGWIALTIALLVLFAILYDNGALLAPLVGERAYGQNYLHEFFHDGRHLLGIPGH